ncbi:MAG TPA: hypothetical protein PLY35_11895 [Thermotogota bacterium]|nr:hypothetical protein [Thermotogota bacterium]
MIVFNKNKIFSIDENDIKHEIDNIYPLLYDDIIINDFSFKSFFNFIIKHKEAFSTLYSHLLSNKSLDEFIIEFNRKPTIKYDAFILISFSKIDLPLTNKKNNELYLYDIPIIDYLIISNDIKSNSSFSFKYLNPISIDLNNIKNLTMNIDPILSLNLIEEDAISSYTCHTTYIKFYDLFYWFFNVLGAPTKINEDLKYKWFSLDDDNYITKIKSDVELNIILNKFNIGLPND